MFQPWKGIVPGWGHHGHSLSRGNGLTGVNPCQGGKLIMYTKRSPA